MTIYRYCIGFVIDAFERGRADIETTEPIATPDDLTETEEFLRERYRRHDLTVVAFSRYTTTDDDTDEA